MALQNPWVKYFDRSYEQIKAAILTTMQTLVPEITDHSESNLWVKMVGIFSGVAEQLGYYIDSAAREAFLGTCRLKISALHIASQLDYRIHARVASSVELTFYTDAPVTGDYVIPIGTEVSTADGIMFTTQANCTILDGQSNVNVAARQHAAAQLVVAFVSDGSSLQTYELPVNLADGQCTIKVGGITWTGKQSLAYSAPTSQHYVQTVNSEDVPIVKFGDGVMGKIPATGLTIQVFYYETEGAAGNVPQASIDQMVTSLPTPTGATSLDVTNNVRASGGSDNETLESLKKRIPMSLRVMDRAVTRQDYIDTAELVAGVAKAGVVYECGKWVDVYIVPEGGGIASDALVDDVQDFIDERRMITTNVRVFPAGENRTFMVIKVHVLTGYDPLIVIAAVKSALALHLSWQNQEIEGVLYLSDLYEVIEAVDGVQNSQIEQVLIKPYAHKVPPTTLTLNWNVAPVASSTTDAWKLVNISGTQFHLFKNGSFLQTITIGVFTALPELVFTINAAAYTVGDEYVFWTYPSDIAISGSIALEEPSIFVSLTSDLTITQY